MSRTAEPHSGAAPRSDRGGDARGHDVASQPPARRSTRWYFAAAVVFGVLAVFVLPTPFSGFASLASVCAFVTGGVRRINSGDPEMVERTTRSGIIGGGGV